MRMTTEKRSGEHPVEQLGGAGEPQATGREVGVSRSARLTKYDAVRFTCKRTSFGEAPVDSSPYRTESQLWFPVLPGKLSEGS